MTDKPFVSVVIPTYNRLEQLCAALDSVLAQSYSNFEVIIVDDGSKDGTREHMESLISSRLESDRPIRYVFQANQGSSVARNRGIAEARGEWIAFLDSDDIWYRDKLQWQVRAVETYKGQCGACITDRAQSTTRERRQLLFAKLAESVAKKSVLPKMPSRDWLGRSITSGSHVSWFVQR